MKSYKYQALVTLYPPEDDDLDAEPPLHVRRLTVQARNRETHQSGIFSALVSAVDGSPLRPGRAGIIATMVVLGDDVRDYLAPRSPVRAVVRQGSRPWGGVPPDVHLTRS